MVKFLNRENFKIIFIVLITAVLLIAAAVFLIYNKKEEQFPLAPQIEKNKTKEGILKELSSDAEVEYTNEEKKQILENLSAPKQKKQLTDEEKEEILKSLNH